MSSGGDVGGLQQNTLHYTAYYCIGFTLYSLSIKRLVFVSFSVIVKRDIGTIREKGATIGVMVCHGGEEGV